MLRFFIFRNVWIALCAVCLVGETLYLIKWNSGTVEYFTTKPDIIFIFFVFSATFFVYNFHAFANHLLIEPSRHFFHLLDNRVSLAQRISLLTGLTGTAITFFFISRSAQVLSLLLGFITLAYTLPILKVKGKRKRLREISYVKILTISLIWSLITVAMPVAAQNLSLPITFFFLLFIERMLFIYSITIPFEIRDMEREKMIGVMTIPSIHGVKNSKKLGYLLLIIFTLFSLIHQQYFSGGRQIAMPLIISALIACVLIYFTNKNRNQWYYKGWIDGTMAFQFILLLLFNR